MGLKGKPRSSYSTAGTLPRGKLSVAQLDKNYIIKLDKLARRWKCETLAEAALELLKDAIDEELRE